MAWTNNLVLILLLGILIKFGTCDEIINLTNLTTPITSTEKTETETTVKELTSILLSEPITKEDIELKLDTATPISNGTSHKPKEEDPLTTASTKTVEVKTTHEPKDKDPLTTASTKTVELKTTHEPKDKDTFTAASIKTAEVKTTKAARLPEQRTNLPLVRQGLPRDYQRAGVKPADIRKTISSTTQTVMTIKGIDFKNTTKHQGKSINKRKHKNHHRRRHRRRKTLEPKSKGIKHTTLKHGQKAHHAEKKHSRRSHSHKSGNRHHNTRSGRHHQGKNKARHQPEQKISNATARDKSSNITKELPHKPIYREKFSLIRNKRSVKHDLQEQTTPKTTLISSGQTSTIENRTTITKDSTIICPLLSFGSNVTHENSKEEEDITMSTLKNRENESNSMKKLNKTTAFASHLKEVIARLRKMIDSPDSSKSITEVLKIQKNVPKIMKTTQKTNEDPLIDSGNGSQKDIIKQFVLGRILTSLSSELSSLNHSETAPFFESPLVRKEDGKTTDLLIGSGPDSVKYTALHRPITADIHIRSVSDDSSQKHRTWLDSPFTRALFPKGMDNRRKRDLEANSATMEIEENNAALPLKEGRNTVKTPDVPLARFPVQLDSPNSNEETDKIFYPQSVVVIHLQHNLKKINAANYKHDLTNEIVPILLGESKVFRNEQEGLTANQVRDLNDVVKQMAEIMPNNIIPSQEKMIYVEKMNKLENNVIKHITGFFPKSYRMSKPIKSSLSKETSSGDDIKRIDEFRRPVYMTLSILLDVLAVFTLFVILYFYLRSNGYCYRVVMVDRRIPEIKINFDRADQKEPDQRIGMNVT